MTAPEQNYTISDTEALAIIKALEHWHHWLEGTQKPINILTDHKNLEYFSKPCILNCQQLRWLDLLSHYNYLISYCPGNQNGVADALSRQEQLHPHDPEEDHPIVLMPRNKFVQQCTMIAELSLQEQEDTLITLAQLTYLSDQDIQMKICNLISLPTLPTAIIEMDGLPYRNNQIFVPDNVEIKQHILGLYHDSPLTRHLGQQGTLALIQRMYWWKNMTQEIKEYIWACATCNISKHLNQAPTGLMQPIPIPHGPWEWTQSDHITGLPKSQEYDTIYVIMDRLTKMAHFISMSTTANAKELVQLHL
jgi:hypothetical protein